MKIERDTNEIETFFESIRRNDAEQREKIDNVVALIRSLNNSIQKIKEEHITIQQITKERFNVFNSLTRHHLEELHSNFLSYLLDPMGSHDCGNGFLKSFLKVLSKNHQLANAFSAISDEDLELAKVERERFVERNSHSGGYGYIDIFIEMPSVNIVIENKIWAGEQIEQIARYAAYCKKLGKEYVILYLTLFGNTSNQAGGEEYYSISYKREIADWLEECIIEYTERQVPMVHVGLTYYKELIHQKILNNIPNTILMKIKDILLKEENRVILKYLKEINEATVEVRNVLRTEFFKSLYQKLQKTELVFIPTKRLVSQIALEEIWDTQYRGFKITNEKMSLVLSNTQKIYFCIEHNWNHIYYGLVVIENENLCPVLRHDYEFLDTLHKIEEIMSQELKYPLRKIEYSWVAWRNAETFKQHIGDDDLNYDFATRKDDLAEQLSGEISVYLDAWENCLKELKS